MRIPIVAGVLLLACGGTQMHDEDAEALDARESSLSSVAIEAEQMTLASHLGHAFSDRAASAGAGLLIWSNGAASAEVSTQAVSSVVVRARGDLCGGSPTLVLSVDGVEIGRATVSTSTWSTHAFSVSLASGNHHVSVAFPNDHRTASCDRNLRIDTLTFVAPAASPTTGALEAESMALPSSNGTIFGEASASGGKALLIWSNGSASQRIETVGARRVVVRARGDLCDGGPRLVVKVDGTEVLSQTVASANWSDYSADVALPDGAHFIEVAFTNDYGMWCDRNLRVDRLSFLGGEAATQPPTTNPPPTSSTTSGNPFASTRFYVDPNSSAKRQADAWRSSRPADAQQIDKIAQNPVAIWLGGWSGDVEAHVRARITEINSVGGLPVFVAYNIPMRDCGNYSAGGANSADEYRTWIRKLRAGIGSHKAVVILEPDALALADCLSSTDRQTRYSLLADAVSVLQTDSAIAAYLDAGHSSWHSATEMAARLNSAGITHARGFALNVSNYKATSHEIAYGKAISAHTSGKPFIIDTSRNGQGDNGEWCNPSGRGLGPKPSASTGDPAVDAFFWIKAPGESDGTCNGGPAAGQWWPGYALGLAQRSSW